MYNSCIQSMIKALKEIGELYEYRIWDKVDAD
jgi:hypothetical protein